MKKVLMLLFLLLSVAAFADTKKYAVGDKWYVVFDFDKPDNFKLEKTVTVNFYQNEYPESWNFFKKQYYFLKSVLPCDNGYVAEFKNESDGKGDEKKVFLSKGLVFYTRDLIETEKKDTFIVTFYKCTITEIYPNYFIAERSEIED